MNLEWQNRGSESESYKVRRLRHKAETSIEYGEKTWTTAQTVRDILQNHLDAETEKYYEDIALILFEKEDLDKCLEDREDTSQKEVTEAFIHTCFMFSKHAKDMTPEAKAMSVKNLQDRAGDLPIKESLKKDGALQAALFLEQADKLEDKLPHVAYNIVDTNTGKSIGFVPFETLRDEKMYHERNGLDFRYSINGIKISDSGSGYDSQLSALYVSSKRGKKHVRGKFGEGVKMSELHLLRNGAKVKMRSQYDLMDEEDKGKSRVWQTRPQVEDGKLVSEGIEIEKQSAGDTSSMLQISLNGANETFSSEFKENVDPRTGGLQKNIADFSNEAFVYSTPISSTEEARVGININGNPDNQYVHGLKVDLASDSFGYNKPWFSYDILDSGIIGGRDRNELKSEIANKIDNFWKFNDREDSIQRLAELIVDADSPFDSVSVESNFFAEALIKEWKNIDSDEDKFQKRIQEMLDKYFLEELQKIGLQPNVPAVIIPKKYFEIDDWRENINAARQQNFKILTIKSTNIDSYTISTFAKRAPKEFQIYGLNEIKIDTREKTTREKTIREKEEEEMLQRVFEKALDAHSDFIEKTGIRARDFKLHITRSEKKARHNKYDPYNIDDEFGWYENEPPSISAFGDTLEVDLTTTHVRTSDIESNLELQQELELYMLGVYQYDKNFSINGIFENGEEDNTSTSEKENELKKTQDTLNKLLVRLLPEDSKLFETMAEDFDYASNPKVLERLRKLFIAEQDHGQEKNEYYYRRYMQAIDVNLEFIDAIKILEECDKNEYNTKRALENRVFALKDNMLAYYDSEKKRWLTTDISDDKQIGDWNGQAVFSMSDGRFFVAAQMTKGAVLSKGEGRKREHIFNDGERFLHIGKYSVSFEDYNNIYEKMSANPDGLVISKASNNRTGNLDYVLEILNEYKYYPNGDLVESKKRVQEGIASTTIPLEYGQDEWDNPIRVFQDIVQNHIDATPENKKVELSYEVERDNARVWLNEKEIKEDDKIIGIRVSDNGSGYSPDSIATMGSSSKKSPLFAGKYGEGQKMVAAAALRNNLELEYQSNFELDGEMHSWSAKAIRQDREIILGGKKVNKGFTAFDVKMNAISEKGSSTILRMPDNISEAEQKQWQEWIKIFDPRIKDDKGNGGMSRFVRQLRDKDKQNVFKLGSITLLVDEPGAVYENGLRINPAAESARNLPFGFDVPEVVTTRERNSYNADRLNYYMQNIIPHIDDPVIIAKILNKIVDREISVRDLGLAHSNNKMSILSWTKVAKELWPGFLVHSDSYYFNNEDDDDMLPMPQTKAEREDHVDKINRGVFISANLRHLDKNKILQIRKDDFDFFKEIMPSVENVLNRLKVETLDIDPKLREKLITIVTECAKVFSAISNKAKESLGPNELHAHITSKLYGFQERTDKWSNKRFVASQKNGVGIAPITAGFHGLADSGVIFNEALLIKKDKKTMLAVALHEMAHLISERGDYTKEFVSLLYELAKYFAEDYKYVPKEASKP